MCFAHLQKIKTAWTLTSGIEMHVRRTPRRFFPDNDVPMMGVSEKKPHRVFSNSSTRPAFAPSHKGRPSHSEPKESKNQNKGTIKYPRIKMANPEYLKILKQGIERWNVWRLENQKILPILEVADFEVTNIRWANLNEADLQDRSFKRRPRPKNPPGRIDAPEMAQPYGQEARQYVIDQTMGKTVKIKIKDIGIHGRSVAEITLPTGQSLNQEILKASLAGWDKRYSKNASLQALADSASTSTLKGRSQKKNLTKESRRVENDPAN